MTDPWERTRYHHAVVATDDALDHGPVTLDDVPHGGWTPDRSQPWRRLQQTTFDIAVGFGPLFGSGLSGTGGVATIGSVGAIAPALAPGPAGLGS